MKKCIRLKTLESFKALRKNKKFTWKNHMWNFCKENTCYIPDEDCFITLNRAIELNFEIEDYGT